MNISEMKLELLGGTTLKDAIEKGIAFSKKLKAKVVVNFNGYQLKFYHDIEYTKEIKNYIVQVYGKEV